MTATPPTYYDILGVPRNADAITIRKSYLRSSLRCHPDKNPGNEELAKAEFVRVGQAYAVLRDEGQRAAYDRELDRSTRKDSSSSSPSASRSRPPPQQPQHAPFSGGDTTASNKNNDAYCTADQDDFDTFIRMFDETVSGMSEEELNVAIGAAAVLGGIIGSIIGARAVKNPFLSGVASVVGGALARQAASTLVQTVHEDSQQRMLERGEREAAIARGETVQGPSSRDSRERVFQDAGRAFQKVASAAVGGTSASSSSRQFSATSNNAGVLRQGQFSWRQAAEVVKMAVDICSDMQQNSRGGVVDSKQYQSHTNR